MKKREYLAGVIATLVAGCWGVNGPDGYNLLVSTTESSPPDSNPITPEADCLNIDNDKAAFDKNPDELVEEAVERSRNEQFEFRISINRAQYMQFQQLMERCSGATSSGKLYVRSNNRIIVIQPTVVRAT